MCQVCCDQEQNQQIYHKGSIEGEAGHNRTPKSSSGQDWTRSTRIRASTWTDLTKDRHRAQDRYSTRDTGQATDRYMT